MSEKTDISDILLMTYLQCMQLSIHMAYKIASDKEFPARSDPSTTKDTWVVQMQILNTEP